MSKQELQHALEQPGVAFLVGTGVSIAATKSASEASWVGLLESLLETVAKYRTSDRAKLRRQIHSKKLRVRLQAAETLVTAIGGVENPEFHFWLRRTVGSLKLEDDRIVRWLQSTGKLLLTTNYDSLLSSPSTPSVPWSNRNQIERILCGAEKGVIHLHGHHSVPESIILGTNSYAKLIGESVAQTIQTTFGVSNSLIFIGCGAGLTDPNFRPFMDWAKTFKKKSAIPWLILCRDSEASQIKKQWPFLVAIPYGKNHDDLPEFLESLKVTSAAPPASSSSPRKADTENQHADELSELRQTKNLLQTLILRVCDHQFEELRVLSRKLRHYVEADTNGLMEETIRLRAGKYGLSYYKARYGVRQTFTGAEPPVIAVSDGKGAKLFWHSIQTSGGAAEVIVLLDPPLLDGQEATITIKVLRKGIWRRLLRDFHENNDIKIRSITEELQLEIVAPSNVATINMRTAPQIGEIHLTKVKNRRSVMWKAKNLSRQEIGYTITIEP